ncbi:MAG TPA: alpha/beta hydrolase [Candidatus Saccharimonadales bacterium]|nr:alpha/beta hydrolase [Candidatus Saccharimonadales bacterium]
MTGVLITLLIFILLGIFGYTWYRLHQELHMHVSSFDDTPEKNGLPYTRQEFTTQDGANLVGWYMSHPNAKAVIVVAHGRKTKEGGKSLFLGHAKYLYNADYSVFLFDMRSVGESAGQKISLGVDEWKDVVAAHTLMKEMPENQGKKIGLYGVSMGASTVLIAAGKERIGDFIIASVPYASFGSLFDYQVRQEKLFPRFLFVWMLQVASFIELGIFYFLVSPIRLVQNINVPIFFMSAKNDTMVNPQDGWKLYEKANKPKEFWEAKTAHDIHEAAPQEFETRVLTFLANYILQQ